MQCKRRMVVEPLESRQLCTVIHPATSAHLAVLLVIERLAFPLQITSEKTTRGTITLSAQNIAGFKLPGPLKFSVYAVSTDFKTSVRIGSIVQNHGFRASSIDSATFHLSIRRRSLPAGDYFVEPFFDIRRVDWVDVSSYWLSTNKIHVS